MERVTPGVKTLLGDPRRAILKLSLPMMAAMLVQSAYNVVDAVWVAGLGQGALAAVGLFFPFFMGLMALATGIGVGGSAAISRRIGAKDRAGASNAALHAFTTGLGLAVLLSVVLAPLSGHIFRGMAAEEATGAFASGYARVLFSGAVFVFLANIGLAVLRGEGDARRAMYAMLAGSLLNIVLDPLFIYGLGLGVVGAAWATLFGQFVSALLVFYWLFLKRDTYVELLPRLFRWDGGLFFEIMRVGVPASLSQISMSLSAFLLNWILLRVAGEAGVAVFTSGWRIVTIGTIPLMGMATGVTAVCGAAYGAREVEKLRVAYLYAVRFGLVLELIVAGMVAILAPYLALLFTYSPGSAALRPELVRFLRWMTVFLPTVPFGMLTSAMFNGIGKGERALLVTILRTLVLQVLGAYGLSVLGGLGVLGVWWGIITGNVCAGLVAFAWGHRTVGWLKGELLPVKAPLIRRSTVSAHPDREKL